MLVRFFLDHPRAVGETYWTHARTALGFSAALFAAAGACFLHALVPGLCRNSASDAVRRLHGELSARRSTSEVVTSRAELA